MIAVQLRMVAQWLRGHSRGHARRYGGAAAGIDIGRDMSLVVWGKMADALAGLDVATIDQPDARAAGARMGAMLLALLEGAPAASLQELGQPLLLRGATIGRCPG